MVHADSNTCISMAFDCCLWVCRPLGILSESPWRTLGVLGMWVLSTRVCGLLWTAPQALGTLAPPQSLSVATSLEQKWEDCSFTQLSQGPSSAKSFSLWLTFSKPQGVILVEGNDPKPGFSSHLSLDCTTHLITLSLSSTRGPMLISSFKHYQGLQEWS